MLPRSTWMFWGQLQQIVGALYLATNQPFSWASYYEMFMGSFILLLAAREAKAVWFAFTLINLLGIIRWTPW